jgi:hypothetical protein
MGARESRLTEYDTVVAATQLSLNQTLRQYLHVANRSVALYGTMDSDGAIVLVDDEAGANFVFTATLAYEVDEHGEPVNFIELFDVNDAQTVYYNATFTKSRFVSKLPPFDIEQKDNTAPWLARFAVKLQQAPTTLDALPAPAQATVRKAMGTLGPDLFSIQKLYIDLNTASQAIFVGVEGLPDLAQAILGSMVRAHLVKQQNSGGIIFGCALTRRQGAEVPVPTFAPTAVDFVVTPYTDCNGTRSNPALDTLNYLVMTEGRPLPKYPPRSFGFNWVDDDAVPGTMAVRSDLFAEAMRAGLAPLLKAISPKVGVNVDGDKASYDQPISLNPGDDHSFTRVAPGSDGTIARFSYDSHDSASGHGPIYNRWTATNEATYHSDCSVQLLDDVVRLSGSIVASAEATFQPFGGSNSDIIMPRTTFRWSVDLRPEMETNGQLNFVLENQDFSAPPEVAGHEGDKKWWEKLLDTFSGNYLAYATTLGNLREESRATVDQAAATLGDLVRTTDHFVFPGGETFTFSEPTFSVGLDLVAEITYLMPTHRPADRCLRRGRPTHRRPA